MGGDLVEVFTEEDALFKIIESFKIEFAHQKIVIVHFAPLTALDFHNFLLLIGLRGGFLHTCVSVDLVGICVGKLVYLHLVRWLNCFTLSERGLPRTYHLCFVFLEDAQVLRTI